MHEPQDLLLSTLLGLPDDRRAELERQLVPLLRAAALGELAGGVAHDVANPLFGAIGLVDLLLESPRDAEKDAAHLRLLKETTLEMKETLQRLLDVARDDGAATTTVEEGVRMALQIFRHGAGRLRTIDERYTGDSASVSCPRGPLVQAVLQFLLAVPGDTIALQVSGPTLRISPAPPTSVGTLVAARIITDHGGSVERDGASLRLRF